MANLVVFGDSWPAGGELSTRHDAFPFLISKKLGLELKQIASDGSSQPFDVHRFIQWLENPTSDRTNSIVLFCFTGKDRSWFFQNGLIRNIHPSIKDPEIIAYYRYLHSIELSDAEALKHILLVQALSKTFGITVRMIMNWDSIPQCSLIDRDMFYPLSLAGILGGYLTSEHGLTNFFAESKYIVPNISHPNVEGHKLIANTLSDWLKPAVHSLV